MTTRLKKKLNDLGVDTSSKKANENFCLIGTPLPPLEKTKDAGEFQPLWKQEVRDEKGRRRLHGAFTGGFSAGYFNTVGSAEGWTPSTFTSSRSERAKQKKARPEDFMDDEDLAELRDSRKLVDTNEQMDVDIWSAEGRKGEVNDADDSITRALEASLLPPAKDSMGAQILRKMGWRLGHGIGPRITYEQRKAQDAQYGDIPSGADDDEEAKKHMYPPRDTRVPAFRRKDNSFGLGYTPGKGLNALGQDDSGKEGVGANISAGFGLGALNDADEDDLDVYDGTAQHRSGRQVAYDGDDDDERVIMGSRTNTSKRSGGSSRTLPNSKKSGPSKDSNAPAGFFRDGSAVIPGFVASEKPVQEEKWFPLPKIPKDWMPNPKRVWEQDKENVESPPEKKVEDGRQQKMSADQRGSLLGETPIPSAPRSVFDYLAPKDRERLQNMASGKVAGEQQSSTSTEEPPPQPTISEPSRVPRLDPQVAKMALQGFQPFDTEPVKHARYTAFLNAQAAGEDAVPFGRMPNQSEDEFAKELSDYAKSAMIFKPMSANMAGRFTSASVVEAGPKPVEGLYRPTPGSNLSNKPDDSEKEGGETQEGKRELSAKENAAKMGMYGPMTREVKTWMPAKLLCKRFGVKEPVIETKEEEFMPPSKSATASSTPTAKEMLAITDGADVDSGVGGASTDIGMDKAPATTTPGRRDIANIGLGEDETQGKDILTYERPAMDIFKAIFASDDEDSDGEDDAPMPSTSHVAVSEVPPVQLVATESRPLEKTLLQTGEVDLATFKPTFAPRSDKSKGKERETHDSSDRKDKVKKKENKNKNKGKTTLMSFDVDMDGGGGDEHTSTVKDKGSTDDRDRERERKRKKRREDKMEIDDESMWVEKPPPKSVRDFAQMPVDVVRAQNEDSLRGVESVGPTRGRKRAIDFM